MPLFYFDVENNEGLILDEEGLELHNLELAEVEAARSLADIIRDAANGRRLQSLTVYVSDAQRRPLFSAKVSFERI